MSSDPTSTASPGIEAADRAEITRVVDTFFSAFVSGPQAADCGRVLREVLLPTAVVVRTCGGDPTAYTVEEFIAPRLELLTSGALQDFREWATDVRVDVFGDIAQVWCSYAKSWSQDGQDQHGRGMKSVQLVRNGRRWLVSAVAWDDERPGLRVPVAPQPPGQ